MMVDSTIMTVTDSLRRSVIHTFNLNKKKKLAIENWLNDNDDKPSSLKIGNLSQHYFQNDEITLFSG